MDATNPTKEVIDYVRVSTNRPVIMASIAHHSGGIPFVPEPGTKIFFTKDWEHKLANGDLIMINVAVVDKDKEIGDYIVALGGESNTPYVEGFIKIDHLNVQFATDLNKALKDELHPPKYLNHVSLFGNANTEIHCNVERPKFVEHEGRLEKNTLINRHLDDLIEQANILKESVDPLVRVDAYARLHFSMDRLQRIESAQYYNSDKRTSREELRSRRGDEL